MNPFRPISISLSPNTEKEDISLALKMMFSPSLWKEGKEIEVLEEEFKKYLGVSNAFSFNSGRSALLSILSSLHIKEGDEVLVQAFTCNAAVNPILWKGLNPVYVDINDSFNMDVRDLERKITDKSRAVMVQHTFGLPADLDEIKDICKKHNLFLIEDCAHSLGATYKGRKVGTFGDAAFFSFSRDKIISSVYGGMAITNSISIAMRIEDFKRNIDFPRSCWIFQQLLHPVLMNYVILPTYLFLGKYLLILFQTFRILSKAVHFREKRGLKPSYFPKKLPNALAILALEQMKKIKKFENHRKELASYYMRELQGTEFKFVPEYKDREETFLRFTVRHESAHKIIKEAWKRNLLIGDWYTSVIAPDDTKLDRMKYVSGSCPNAERLSKETINLPTHINISKEEAEKITEFLENIR